MTNAVFSTVDRLTSRLKLVDSLVNNVAAHLLPQHGAKANACPPGWTYGGSECYPDYCNITYDLHRVIMSLCYNPDNDGPLYARECCDCCNE